MIHTDGKRRRTPRSVEQCEREIQRLQASLDGLRSQIGEVEMSRAVLNTDAEDEEEEDDDDEDEDGGVRVVGQGKRPLSNGDTKMRSIISRYDSPLTSISVTLCLPCFIHLHIIKICNMSDPNDHYKKGHQ